MGTPNPMARKFFYKELLTLYTYYIIFFLICQTTQEKQPQFAFLGQLMNK